MSPEAGVGRPASAAVLGAGTIGLSAAAWFAAHDVPTTVVARRAEVAAAAPEMLAQRLERLAELGAIAPAQVRTARSHLSIEPRLPPDGRFALVFEAVAEDLDAKRAVLAVAEAGLADDGVLVSTTSSLPIDALADGLADPARFAGWHWFHPADLMRLVEIVPGARTSPQVVRTLSTWSTGLARRAIVLRCDVPGFVANRLQYALLREAYALVEAGVCEPEDVDAAVTAGLGPRWAAVGPFATMDLAGLGVHAAVAASLFPRLSNRVGLPDLLRRAREHGAGGAREGRGLLGRYSDARRIELEARRDRTLVAVEELADGS
jgi:3-hydroxybutyryl-CoA dehydrogenase